MGSERIEIPLGFAVWKRKVMPNGEQRLSLTLTSGQKVSVTTMRQWNPAEEMPWQEAHYHQGLEETYYILEGEAWFIWMEGELVMHRHLTEPHQPLVFQPSMPHLVILAPDAEILTIQTGAGVGNPERNNNDWFPASSEFHEQAKAEKAAIEFQLRCSYVPLAPDKVPEPEE